MNTSGRRFVQASAAVLGLTALGAVGSGTAFADTVTDFGGATDRYGNTDHTAAYDSAGLPTDAVDSSEYESFEMPSVPERTARHSARGTNLNTTSSDSGKSDTGSSDTGSSDTGSSDTGSSDTGSSDTGKSHTGKSHTGKSHTGKSHTGKSHTGKSHTGKSHRQGNDGNSNSGFGGLL